MIRGRLWGLTAIAWLTVSGAGLAQQTPAPSGPAFKDDSFRQPPPPPPAAPAAAPSDDRVTTMPAPRPGEVGRQQDMSDDDDDDDDTAHPPSTPNGGPRQGGLPKDAPYWRQGQPRRGGWVQMGTATLQALDKINARAVSLTVKVGEAGHFGSLDIGVRGCLVRPNDQPADATAFLVVRDRTNPDTPVFNGWMVRSAPFMSMMAHPIYDIRISGCAP